MIRIVRELENHWVHLYIKQNESDDENQIFQDVTIVYLYDSASNVYKYRVIEKWKELSSRDRIVDFLKGLVAEYCQNTLRGICD